MKALRVFWILVVAGGVLAAEPTNLIEVLRNFQRDLDAREEADKLMEVQRAPRKRQAQPQKGIQPAPATNAVVMAPVALTPAVSVAGPTAGEERLAEADVIAVEVVDEPDLSLARGVISKEGAVQCPMLGAVVVGGKTVAEAEESVRGLLAKDYLVDPKVNVKVLERGRCAFTILQNVVKPGTYAWSPKENMTLLRAIGMAGGVTRSAVLSKITVQRNVNGKVQVLKVDLDAMNRDRNAAPFQVQTGDVIEVGGR